MIEKRNLLHAHIYFRDPSPWPGEQAEPKVHVLRIKEGQERCYQEHRLTEPSWRRLMYLVDKYSGFMCPDCLRRTSDPKDATRPWSLFLSIDKKE